MKREFLQLAHNYEPTKQSIGNWFVSIKLDGMRALWDGGITKGMSAKDVPWANTLKDARYKKPVIATGLWSRYGNVIHCPSWWSDKLPPFALDGELYIGNNTFQYLMSTVKDLEPGAGWTDVKFMVLDAPSLEVVLAPGKIDNTNYKKLITTDTYMWVKERVKSEKPVPFEQTISRLINRLPINDVVRLHQQTQLPVQDAAARVVVREMLDHVTDAGGEGLIIRHPSKLWVPERSHSVLKVKKLNDSEATVVGYTWGRETDKGSKLLGMMGAMIVSWNGHEFELSGFTDEERRMNIADYDHPGERVGPGFYAEHFPIGSKVTFRYRELSDGGIPKEARYWRKDPTITKELGWLINPKE